MKKILALICLVASSTAVVGCSNANSDPETSTRYSNVSIIETTEGTSTVDGEVYKNGGIRISVAAYSANADIFVMVVPHGSDAPTNKQLESQEDYGNVKVNFAFTATGMLYKFIDDSEFVQGEKYDCYAIIKNDGNFADYQYKTTVFTYEQTSLLYKGEGTLKSPYTVSTIEDLEAVGVVTAERPNALSAYYKLENNIDLSSKYYEGGESWNPIGQVNGKRNKFAGTFDGQGYTISNLYQNTDIEGTGLFSELDVAGWIMNLVMTNVDIYTTTQRTSAVVGYCKGNVFNVAVIGGSIYSTANRCGGITGHMYDNGIINSVYVDADITSTGGSAGGVVGQASSVSGSYIFSIKNAQFTGNVTGKSYAGGIVGAAEDTIIENCITANVNAYSSDGRAAGIGGSIKAKSRDAQNVWNNIVYNVTVDGKNGSGVLYSDGNSTGCIYSNNQYNGVTSGTVFSNSLNTSQTTSKTLDVLFGDTNLKTVLNYALGSYTFRTGNFPMINIAYDFKYGNDGGSN